LIDSVNRQSRFCNVRGLSLNQADDTEANRPHNHLIRGRIGICQPRSVGPRSRFMGE